MNTDSRIVGVVGAGIGLWLAPVFAVGVHVFWPSALPAIAIGIALAAAVAVATARTMTETLAPLLRHAGVAVLVAVGAAAAIGQIARISVYMAAPSQSRWSCYANDPFRVRHSCMTAYAEAVRFSREPGTNIYQMDLYEPRMAGPLKIDSYHYPPPFLLLPGAVRAVAPDLFAFRGLWFVMQCLVLAAVVFGIARWIGGEGGARAAAGAVLAFATPQFVYALQQGNVQSTAVAIAVLAVVLLWSGRHLAGAPLLAYVATAKIFPGILIVYLAGARRWKALAATAVAGVAVVALTLAVFGARPFQDFLHDELPRISSGEAFPQTETFAYGVNFSVYGVTVRWRKLGLDWLTRPRGLAVASGYGAAVILLAALAGWRARPDRDTSPGRLRLVQCGLALLVLSSMRSPFVPGYGLVAVIWLLTLLAAGTSTPRALLRAWAAIAAIAVLPAWMPSPGVVPQPVHLFAADLLTMILISTGIATVARSWRDASMPARSLPLSSAAS